MKLNLSVDEVLSTTRSVRKRLDVTRPVPRAEIEECLELALQAPNGSNLNRWHWVVVDDRRLIGEIAEIYKTLMRDFVKNMGGEAPYPGTLMPRGEKMMESAVYWLDTLDRMPAMLIPLMEGRPEGKSVVEQASMWGSIVQSVWSFFLALRERGMGSAWTTITLARESEIAALLGIPYAEFTQIGMFPIAYTIGTEFKKAWRRPLAEVLSYNRFQRS